MGKMKVVSDDFADLEVSELLRSDRYCWWNRVRLLVAFVSSLVRVSPYHSTLSGVEAGSETVIAVVLEARVLVHVGAHAVVAAAVVHFVLRGR